MNVQTQATPLDPVASGPAAPVYAPTRPFYWSVRRELWENRSLYLAPTIVAAVVLFATAMNTLRVPDRMRIASESGSYSAVVLPFSMAPSPIMLASFIVALFYCLDALYGERRDRSMLFWKSLPVSDRITVLSKASIPLVVLPSITYGLCVITQVVLLQLTTLVLLANGISPGPLYVELRFFDDLVIMVYGLTVHALWFAPIYAWLLLMSAWARRAPVLWALVPPLLIAATEGIVFGTRHFMTLLQYRVAGAMQEAFKWTNGGGPGGDIEKVSQLTPLRFVGAPGLWIGLLFAAGCIALAIRLRREREPG